MRTSPLDRRQPQRVRPGTVLAQALAPTVVRRNSEVKYGCCLLSTVNENARSTPPTDDAFPLLSIAASTKYPIVATDSGLCVSRE